MTKIFPKIIAKIFQVREVKGTKKIMVKAMKMYQLKVKKMKGKKMKLKMIKKEKKKIKLSQKNFKSTNILVSIIKQS